MKMIHEIPNVQYSSDVARTSAKVMHYVNDLHDICMRISDDSRTISFINELTGEILNEIPVNDFFDCIEHMHDYIRNGEFTEDDVAQYYEEVLCDIINDYEVLSTKNTTTVESVQNEFGSIEYEKNEGKLNRIKRYRAMTLLDESELITEDNIMRWAFDKICMEENISPNRLKSELLGEL